MCLYCCSWLSSIHFHCCITLRKIPHIICPFCSYWKFWLLVVLLPFRTLLIRTFLYKTVSTYVIFLFDYFLKSKFWYMKFLICSNAPRKIIWAGIVEIILEESLLNIASENSHSFGLLCFFLFGYWWDFKKYIYWLVILLILKFYF